MLNRAGPAVLAGCSINASVLNDETAQKIADDDLRMTTKKKRPFDPVDRLLYGNTTPEAEADFTHASAAGRSPSLALVRSHRHQGRSR